MLTKRRKLSPRSVRSTLAPRSSCIWLSLAHHPIRRARGLRSDQRRRHVILRCGRGTLVLLRTASVYSGRGHRCISRAKHRAGDPSHYRGDGRRLLRSLGRPQHLRRSLLSHEGRYHRQVLGPYPQARHIRQATSITRQRGGYRRPPRSDNYKYSDKSEPAFRHEALASAPSLLRRRPLTPRTARHRGRRLRAISWTCGVRLHAAS